MNYRIRLGRKENVFFFADLKLKKNAKLSFLVNSHKKIEGERR